jgi:hypothetical protein
MREVKFLEDRLGNHHELASAVLALDRAERAMEAAQRTLDIHIGRARRQEAENAPVSLGRGE